MESQKRERSANFTTAEIELLVNLVKKWKLIVENKKTDAVTNKEKENGWKKIEHTFNSCGLSTTVRSWKTLKLKYEGIKKTMKKKSSLQRQEMYRTGGGPSNAPDFNVIEEQVLSICSNITGLEARHDSDIITIPQSEPVVEEFEISFVDDEANINQADFGISELNPDEKVGTCNPILQTLENQAAVEIPDMDESFCIDDTNANEDCESQKENKWTKWNPKYLKTKVSNVLKKETATKSSVTYKLDKLSTARLELVQLQKEIAQKQHEFVEKEHTFKMRLLANDEKRKEEIHALLLQKMKSAPTPGDAMKIFMSEL